MPLSDPQVAVLDCSAQLFFLLVSAGDRFAPCLSLGRRIHPSVWRKTTNSSLPGLLLVQGFSRPGSGKPTQLVEQLPLGDALTLF